MEKIKDNLSTISACILILGTINVSIYYSLFGIDILSYLDFSEVLQIQFKVFAISSASLVLFFIFFFPLFSYINFTPKQKARIEQIRREIEIESYLNSKNILLPYHKIDTIVGGMDVRTGIAANFAERKPIKVSKIRTDIVAAVILFLLPIATLLPYHISLKQETKFWLIISTVPIFVTIVIVAYFHIKQDNSLLPTDTNKIQDRISLYKFICFFIAFAYLGACYAATSALSIVIHDPNYSVSFIIDGKAICTNNNYRYVGKTKEYICIYDISKEKADIFKIDNINYLSIIKYKKQKESTPKQSRL